jgi:DNA-binding NtrC family response regulator
MNERRDFGELFAHPMVRHSVELASTLWGASICIVDDQLEAQFPAVAPLPIVELLRELLSHRRYRKEFELYLSPLFVSTPDWTGPRWFELLPGLRQLVTPIGTASGITSLLCVPFAYRAESEEQEQDALNSLVQSLRSPLVQGAADQVPVLDSLARRKLQTHMSTLGRELDILMSRVTRRVGDLPKRPEPLPGLVGIGASTEALKLDVKGAAIDDAPLLILGEVGTGKRSLARSLHRISRRRVSPLLEIDCESTSPHELTERLLGSNWSFGSPPEVVSVAGSGTVLLHEVQCLPRRLQQLLLSLLDEWEGPHQDGFRLIATSSHSIDTLERLGALRTELYELLRANTIEVPSLRQRKEDIPSIAADMLMRMRAGGGDLPGAFSKEATKAFQSYSWPGNMWELQTEVRSSARRARGRDEVILEDLSQRILAIGRGGDVPQGEKQWVTLPEAVESLERSMLMEALGATRWNRSRTAKLLGISRRNLIRKISRYRLDRRKRNAVAGQVPDRDDDDED